jgi:hypothetical protein
MTLNMVLDDMADYLSSGGMGTVYKDFLPPTPDTVTTVHTTLGNMPTFTMNGPAVLQEPRVQVQCRSMSLESAHANARSAYELLCGLKNRTINGVLYHWVKASYEPVLIGKDQNARFTVACNYDIKKDRST